VTGWRDARAEVIIAAILVAVAAVAALLVAGWPGVAVVAVVTTALTLLALRGLAPRPASQSARQARKRDAAGSRITGYSQRKFMVSSAMTSREFYENDLRAVLEHLLAARLAERHGLNLYTDPDAARRAFVAAPADMAAWNWIDPAQRPAGPAGSSAATPAGHGIPRRALTRLIDRLEHL
jgi:hypothetical protein